MKFIFSLIVLFISANCFAQTRGTEDEDTAGRKKPDSVFVTVHKDPRLDLLVKKQATINEVTSRDSRRTDKGFRLMIISTNKRDEALAAKTKVYTFFPQLKAYLWYQSPYFRVKAGNFKDKKEAEEWQRKLNVHFPKGVFIMPDIIEVKPVKPGEEEEDINS